MASACIHSLTKQEATKCSGKLHQIEDYARDCHVWQVLWFTTISQSRLPFFLPFSKLPSLFTTPRARLRRIELTRLTQHCN